MITKKLIHRNQIMNWICDSWLTMKMRANDARIEAVAALDIKGVPYSPLKPLPHVDLEFPRVQLVSVSMSCKVNEKLTSL